MKKPKFSITHKDQALLELVNKTDHKTLAVWAIACVERVLPYFEDKYPADHRPRSALETLQAWIETGVFKMAVIRGASLASHAAAREVGEASPARSAARAAGQAVATAHVPTHSIGAANYALQAIHRAVSPDEAEAAVAKEREWQFRRLLELREMKVDEILMASETPTPPEQALTCLCFTAPQHTLGLVKHLGMDDSFAEISILTCPVCGQLWLRYHFELEAFTASGRWYMGAISAEQAIQLTAENAKVTLENLSWYFYGGSYYGGRSGRTSGRILLNP